VPSWFRIREDPWHSYTDNIIRPRDECASQRQGKCAAAGGLCGYGTRGERLPQLASPLSAQFMHKTARAPGCGPGALVEAPGIEPGSEKAQRQPSFTCVAEVPLRQG
jgi:hypothetical protein